MTAAGGKEPSAGNTVDLTSDDDGEYQVGGASTGIGASAAGFPASRDGAVSEMVDVQTTTRGIQLHRQV